MPEKIEWLLWLTLFCSVNAVGWAVITWSIILMQYMKIGRMEDDLRYALRKIERLEKDLETSTQGD